MQGCSGQALSMETKVGASGRPLLPLGPVGRKPESRCMSESTVLSCLCLGLAVQTSPCEVHLCQRCSGRWVGTVTSGSFLITLYRGSSETVFSGELITVEITGWQSRQSCCEGSLPLSHKLPLPAATPTEDRRCSSAQDSQTASAPSHNYLLSHQPEQEVREGNDHRDKPLCSQDTRNPWEPPHLKTVTHGQNGERLILLLFAP